MTTIFALLSIAAPISIPVHLRDRAAFCRSIARVRPGLTKTQVRHLLGPPDDVWSPPTQRSEIWCYGTNGHHTLPTLGHVLFENNKVRCEIGGEGKPPSQRIIREKELVDALRQMDRAAPNQRRTRSDSLRLVQVSNLLINKGQAKALAILKEYCRIGPTNYGFYAWGGPNDDWMFWMVRVAFTSKRPGGVFPVPSIGATLPAPPSDLRRWPTYPVMIVDDVPICLFQGADLAGFPEQFGWYLDAHAKEWTLRKKTLKPPIDPFLAFKKVIASTNWPWPASKDDNDRSWVEEGFVLREILTLVRGAYQPKHEDLAEDSIDGRDYEKYHREFLALRCHWDERRQEYVRDLP